jgi:hypothetical protein
MRISAVAALAGAFLLPQKAFAGNEGNLIVFLGIIIAAVIPAMALMATVLRAAPHSVADVQKIGRALMVQYDFWAGVVVVGAFVCAALLLGALLGWKTHAFHIQLWNLSFDADPVILLNGCVAGGLCLLAHKGKPFLEGFRSLLELQVEQVEKEAREAFDQKTASTSAAVRAKKPDEKFGEIVRH